MNREMQILFKASSRKEMVDGKEVDVIDGDLFERNVQSMNKALEILASGCRSEEEYDRMFELKAKKEM